METPGKGRQGDRFHRGLTQAPASLPGPQSSPGSPVASVADTFPGRSVTSPLDTGGAGRATALPEGAARAGVFTPEVRQDFEWGLAHLPSCFWTREPNCGSSAVKLRYKEGLEAGDIPNG